MIYEQKTQNGPYWAIYNEEADAFYVLPYNDPRDYYSPRLLPSLEKNLAKASKYGNYEAAIYDAEKYFLPKNTKLVKIHNISTWSYEL